MSEHKTYPLTSSPLYRMRNRKKLANLLRLDSTYFSKRHCYQYRSFSKTKPNGEIRWFADPIGNLKVVQKRINKLLRRIETPDWIKSGKKGESYITNGLSHLSADYVRTMDISHFYDSVRRDAVYAFFRFRLQMADDIATIITNLVLNGNTLPTGSPTSQTIAFWAYRDMFDEINELAESYGCKFSLYVDDMTFSSFSPIPYSLRNEVGEILHKYGLHAKRRKDRYYKENEFKTITGVGFVGELVDLPNDKKKELVRLYKDYKKSDVEVSTSTLKGKLNAARQIKPDLFLSFEIEE